MKLKIRITGPKVHEVGYRYFLMTHAMDLGLSGFHARNRTGDKELEVISLVEGDSEVVEDFKRLVVIKRPIGAEVSGVEFEDYSGEVMSVGVYAQVCTAHQINKAIPVLLDIRDSSKAMLEKQDRSLEMQSQTLEEIKGLKDTQSQTLEEIKGVKEEIKGLRGDVQSGDVQHIQMQADIKAIKARLGMP